MYGTGDQKYRVQLSGGRFYDSTYKGVIPNLERRHKETDSEFMRKDIERFMRERKCTACNGMRLKPVVLAVTVHGLSIMDVCNLGVDDAIELFNNLKLTDDEQFIARQIFQRNYGPAWIYE